MSGRATGWVLRHGPTPADVDRQGRPYGGRARGLRSVLVAVADAANPDGEHAHPGIDNVASAALYGRRQTVNLLAELVAEGWLQIEEVGGGRGMATVYCLPRMILGNRATPAPTEPPERVQPLPEKGCNDGPERVQPGAETMHSRVHPNDLSTEQTNGTDQRTPAAGALPLPLSSSEEKGRDRARVIRESAGRLLNGWWESKTPRPTQSYVGARKVLERLLDAGWSEAQVFRALPEVPIISARACELALRRTQPGPAASEPIDADRDEGDGSWLWEHGEWVLHSS